VVPEESTDSIVVLQHELAIERAAAGDFCRLVWMPPGLAANDARQQQFIEHLETDARLQAGADILKTALEDFKSILHVRLSPPEPPKPDRPPAPPERSALRRIYLICDDRDVAQAQPIADYLFDEFEVTLPVFEGDEAQVRTEHEANLAECDAALIYYGAANELWLRSKLRELKKIAGYGRSKPMIATAVYVAPPDTTDKRRFRTHEAVVINPGSAFVPSALEPFVGLLRQG
jgi:hypothetical protein